MGRAREGMVVPFRVTILAKMGAFSKVSIFAVKLSTLCRQLKQPRFGAAFLFPLEAEIALHAKVDRLLHGAKAAAVCLALQLCKAEQGFLGVIPV